jgi:hypothetical protein
MVDTIVLRFRDFIENTVEAHVSFIEKEPGFVWWGWWKKEDEPAHREVLEELREKLKVGPITIGIFDRSTRRYYTACLRDCVFAVGSPMSRPIARRPRSIIVIVKWRLGLGSRILRL